MRKLLIAVICVCLFLIAYFAIADKQEDVIRVLENRVGISDAYTIYEICNPTDKPIKLKHALKHSLKHTNRKIKSIEYFMNASGTREVVEKVVNSTITNCTIAENGTEVCNTTIIYDEVIHYVPVEIWKPIDKELNPGECVKIKKVGKFDAKLGKISINAETEFMGHKKTWWNATWGRCRDITIVADGTARVNEPITVNLTGLIFSNASAEVRIVNAPCNEGGSEVPQKQHINGTDWVLTTFKLDSMPANTNVTYSVYYNASGANTHYLMLKDGDIWNKTYNATHDPTESGWTKVGCDGSNGWATVVDVDGSKKLNITTQYVTASGEDYCGIFIDTGTKSQGTMEAVWYVKEINSEGTTADRTHQSAIVVEGMNGYKGIVGLNKTNVMSMNEGELGNDVNNTYNLIRISCGGSSSCKVFVNNEYNGNVSTNELAGYYRMVFGDLSSAGSTRTEHYWSYVAYLNEGYSEPLQTELGEEQSQGADIPITVYSPQNTTYYTSTILVNFTAENYDTLWYFNETDNKTYTIADELCYQEFANVSACGNDANNVDPYNFSGSSGLTGTANMTDGDWDTEEFIMLYPGKLTIVSKYRIPKNYSTANYTFKTSNGIFNVSVHPDCLLGENLTIKYYFSLTGDNAYVYCMNHSNSQYILIYTLGNAYSDFYEEGIYWINKYIEHVTLGVHTFTFYANDTSGNVNSTSVTFTVTDAIKPNITVYSPENTTYTTENVTIDFTATDNIAVDTLWYSNGTDNKTYTQEVVYVDEPSSINVDEYGIVYYANYTKPNNTISALCEFITSFGSGNISIPEQCLNFYEDVVALYYFSVSLEGADYTKLYCINSSGNTWLNWTYLGTFDGSDILDVNMYYNVSYETLNDGHYTFTFYANDTSGNVNSTSVAFTVDATPPVVTHYTPAGENLSLMYEGSTQQHVFAVNLSEDTTSVDTVYLVFNNQTYAMAEQECYNSECRYSTTLTGLQAGTYQFYYAFNNTVGLSNTTGEETYRIVLESSVGGGVGGGSVQVMFPYCGDGVCTPLEKYYCPEDCLPKNITAFIVGDGICSIELGETPYNSPDCKIEIEENPYAVYAVFILIVGTAYILLVGRSKNAKKKKR